MTRLKNIMFDAQNYLETSVHGGYFLRDLASAIAFSLYSLCQSKFCFWTVSPRSAAFLPDMIIKTHPIAVKAIMMLARRILMRFLVFSITSWLSMVKGISCSSNLRLTSFTRQNLELPRQFCTSQSIQASRKWQWLFCLRLFNISPNLSFPIIRFVTCRAWTRSKWRRRWSSGFWYFCRCWEASSTLTQSQNKCRRSSSDSSNDLRRHFYLWMRKKPAITKLLSIFTIRS